MAVSNVINKVSEWINKVSMVTCVVLLGAMVIITFVQIICRVFFTALSWSEELARYLLVWSTMLGAGCVYKGGGHISVLVVQDLLPESLKKYAKIIVQVLCACFFAVAVFYGIKYMGMLGTQKSASLNIQMKYMYFSIPLGCGIMFIHAIAAIISGLYKKAGEKE